MKRTFGYLSGQRICGAVNRHRVCDRFSVVIAREGGRSSTPRRVTRPIGRGVLDTPPSRGMTAIFGATYLQLSRVGERKRRHAPRILVQDQRARDRRLGALAAVFAFAEPAVDADRRAL